MFYSANIVIYLIIWMGFYMFLGIWLLMYLGFSGCKDSDDGVKV